MNEANALDDRMKQKLERFIGAAAGATDAMIAGITPLDDGKLTDAFLRVELRGGAFSGTQHFVMRSSLARPRGEAPALSPLTPAQEYAVLRAAFAAGVAVAEPLWECLDPAVAGMPFFLTRRLAGEADAALVDEAKQGGDRKALLTRLGEEIARLHSIKPPNADLDFLKVPRPTPAAQFIAELRAFLDRHPEPHPVLEWGLRWMELNAPRAEVALVHRDFRTGNYVVDGRGLIGIVGWQSAGWGDPMEDIGNFCTRCWRFGAATKEAGGLGSRADFYAGYARIAGHMPDPRSVAYWELGAHIRRACLALKEGDRHLYGDDYSLERALTGRAVAELELELLTATAEDLSHDSGNL